MLQRTIIPEIEGTAPFNTHTTAEYDVELLTTQYED